MSLCHSPCVTPRFTNPLSPAVERSGLAGAVGRGARAANDALSRHTSGSQTGRRASHTGVRGSQTGAAPRRPEEPPVYPADRTGATPGDGFPITDDANTPD